MKKMLIILALLVSTSLLNPAVAKEFSLATLTNYAPYSFYDEEDGWQGYAIDLANRLIQTPTDEHSLSFVVNPTWKRSLRSIEAGRLDFLWEVSYNAERAKYMEYIGVTDVERMQVVVQEWVQFDPITDFDQFFDLGEKLGHKDAFVSFSAESEHGPAFNQRFAKDKKFADIFEDDDAIVTDLGDGVWPGLLVAMGRIPARLFTESDAFVAVKTSDKVVQTNPRASRLKAISVPAFGDPLTYIVMPKVMPEEYKQLITSNYMQARKDGSFEKIWKKWFKGRELPPNTSTM